VSDPAAPPPLRVRGRLDRPRNTLIVYGLLQHPLRSTIRDHLYSFRELGDGRHYYLNVAARRVPRWVGKVPFDAVVFHHTLTGQRMEPRLLRWELRRARALDGVGRYRIAMVQDECIYMDAIDEFIADYDIDEVFSVAPPSEWEKIYPQAVGRGVRFSQNLTGYLSRETVGRVDRIVAETPQRDIGIGYRAWGGLMSLGRLGQRRTELERVFAAAAADRGISADLSTDLADTLHGDDWFRFLARCRYVIGAEGGATVLDRDGRFMEATQAYLAEHPEAGFDEVEAACFPGEDGKLQLHAISPRHIEACATRTCQVLVEGDYSGVLRAGEHYIELKRDLANLDEVMGLIESDSERERITENAYSDIVASGRYGYSRLVGQVQDSIESGLERKGAAEAVPRPGEGRLDALLRRANREDKRSWARVAVGVRVGRALRRVREAVRG
jgi:hypothetical protein